MKINNSILQLDIKMQDKLRELLAHGEDGLLKITGVQLGDSDVDYNQLNINENRVLNAPFNVNKVKYPLIFSGTGRGLEGNITCFARKVVEEAGVTKIYSLYDWPNNSNFTYGNTAPILNNGYDWNNLDFDETKMGYVIFFQTLLLNYFDATLNLQSRFNEPLDIEVSFNGSTTLPPGWEITIDSGTRQITEAGVTMTVYHNSMLICKDATGISTAGLNTDGQISVTGNLSNINKKITFNI